MATEEKILTKHPLGKSGKNISKKNYHAVKETMLSVLDAKELTHTELLEQMEKRLKGKFDGNISWYAETVKLDLEARKIIERTASLAQGLIVQHPARQHFYRYFTLQPLVAGAIYFTHSAGADSLEDAIVPQPFLDHIKGT